MLLVCHVLPLSNTRYEARQVLGTLASPRIVYQLFLMCSSEIQDLFLHYLQIIHGYLLIT